MPVFPVEIHIHQDIVKIMWSMNKIVFLVFASDN